MTNEEAITELSVLWERFNNGMGWRDGQYEEALDMAIEALSAEPKTIANNCDLISRADAIEAVLSVPMPLRLADEIDEVLRLLPSADRPIQGGDAEMNPIPNGTGVMQETPSEDGSDLISRADAEAFVCMERCGEYRKDCPAQTCPTIEHFDNIPSANLTELLEDGTLKVNVQNGADVGRVLVWGDDGSGGLYYADDSDDAVEVIRCKDCKWWDMNYSFCTEHYSQAFDPNGNGFCSNGVRYED